VTLHLVNPTVSPPIKKGRQKMEQTIMKEMKKFKERENKLGKLRCGDALSMESG
jgi:hypothetical protein